MCIYHRLMPSLNNVAKHCDICKDYNFSLAKILLDILFPPCSVKKSYGPESALYLPNKQYQIVNQYQIVLDVLFHYKILMARLF